MLSGPLANMLKSTKNIILQAKAISAYLSTTKMTWHLVSCLVSGPCC